MLKKDIKFLTVDILVFGFWSKLLGRIECRRVWRNTIPNRATNSKTLNQSEP